MLDAAASVSCQHAASKTISLGPLVYSAFKPCFGSIARMLWGDHPGCSRVTDSAEPPPHFISHFCKTVFQQCFVSVNSSSSRTPLPAPRLNERQPQRVIQTQNQLHRDNTHGARGLHWQTLPPPPQPAAAFHGLMQAAAAPPCPLLWNTSRVHWPLLYHCAVVFPSSREKRCLHPHSRSSM